MKKIIALLMIAFSYLGVSAATTPSFPGGDAALQTYITENLQYPSSAKDNGIEGVVSVTFTVKADGSIGNIKIKRMVDPDLEAEAIRLVKGMPKWTPSDAGEAQAEVDIPFTL
ncbi:MAG: energy transducer TonB [Muribaculaceae bacterium]|nr:energy transducer TonB [Muribaculaceae bacterium]